MLDFGFVLVRTKGFLLQTPAHDVSFLHFLAQFASEFWAGEHCRELIVYAALQTAYGTTCQCHSIRIEAPLLCQTKFMNVYRFCVHDNSCKDCVTIFCLFNGHNWFAVLVVYITFVAGRCSRMKKLRKSK